jgi:hypothetical protein
MLQKVQPHSGKEKHVTVRMPCSLVRREAQLSAACVLQMLHMKQQRSKHV